MITMEEEWINNDGTAMIFKSQSARRVAIREALLGFLGRPSSMLKLVSGWMCGGGKIQGRLARGWTLDTQGC